MKRGTVFATNAPQEIVDETMAFGDAIINAIDDLCDQRQAAGQAVVLISVIGALVSVLAHHIAGIPDEEQRQQQYRKVGHELAEMIVTNAHLGTHALVADAEDIQ